MIRTKIKVDNVKLLAALRSSRQKCVVEFQKQVAKYERRMKELEPRLCGALETAQENIKKGEYPQSDYRGAVEIPTGIRKMPKPPTEPDLGEIDSMIAAIEMSAEETTPLTPQEVTRLRLNV